MLTDVFQGLVERLRAETIAYYGDRLVTLAVFGSAGRGTPGPESDVDILLVVDPLPTGRMKRVQEFARIEEHLGDLLLELVARGINTSIAPVFKTPGEVALGSLLFLDMIDDAKILFDRDGFFAGFLQQLKGKLEQLGARKVPYRGAWYWDLKPDFRKGDVIDL